MYFGNIDILLLWSNRSEKGQVIKDLWDCQRITGHLALQISMSIT
jgi:hypothetical protein